MKDGIKKGFGKSLILHVFNIPFNSLLLVPTNVRYTKSVYFIDTFGIQLTIQQGLRKKKYWQISISSGSIPSPN